METNEESVKITTKTYYCCGKCKEKLETISLGSGSDFLGLMSGSKTAMYCGNKECENFGFLTVVGLKREE